LGPNYSGRVTQELPYLTDPSSVMSLFIVIYWLVRLIRDIVPSVAAEDHVSNIEWHRGKHDKLVIPSMTQ